jgi:hypothetical protein
MWPDTMAQHESNSLTVFVARALLNKSAVAAYILDHCTIPK